MRSTGTLASSVACPSPAGEHCPRRVRPWKGTFVAVCNDPEYGCEDVELTFEQLMVLELDVGELAGSLCRLLSCELGLRPLRFVGRAWSIGCYEPLAGKRLPLLLEFPTTADEAHATAVRLVGHLGQRFILFMPDRDAIEPETGEYLRAHRVCLLFLEEFLTVDAEGTWKLLRSAEEILAEARGSVLDDPRLRALPHEFATPPGIRWSDITIRFIDQHQVHVQAGRTSDVLHFTQLGMADARKNPAEPNRQWALLVDFAEGDGVVRWSTTAENRRRQKQKEELSKLLRAFLGLSEDPFEPLEDRRGWRARFRIIPED